jgi:hypothetical protein
VSSHGDARLQLLAPPDRVVVGAASSTSSDSSSSTWRTVERIGIVLGVAASVVTLHHYLRG